MSRVTGLSLLSITHSIPKFDQQVAEFANVRKQLEVLEDRLEAMVQPRLTDALTYHKVGKYLETPDDVGCGLCCYYWTE